MSKTVGAEVTSLASLPVNDPFPRLFEPRHLGSCIAKRFSKPALNADRYVRAPPTNTHHQSPPTASLRSAFRKPFFPPQAASPEPPACPQPQPSRRWSRFQRASQKYWSQL